MEKPSSKIKLPPPEEWKFSKIKKDQAGLCFIWESLRCIKKPSPDELDRLIVSISFKAADSDWFQKFCRCEEFRPVKLFAWISANSHWPDKPWTRASREVLKALKQIETFPSIVEASGPAFLRDRYSSKLQEQFDFFCFPILRETMSEAKELPSDQVTLTGFTAFELLKNCRAIGSHSFLINRQQYTPKEVIGEFKKWVEVNWPEKVKKFQNGGRVQPTAWLAWLSAYRLWAAVGGDSETLKSWRNEYMIEKMKESRSTEKSVISFARKFYGSVLSEFIPEDHLPQEP